MFSRRLTQSAVLIPLLFVAGQANAYIGPGAGLGTIVIVLGVLAGILLLFLAVLWYPLKRWYRKLRTKSDESESQSSGQE